MARFWRASRPTSKYGNRSSLFAAAGSAVAGLAGYAGGGRTRSTNSGQPWVRSSRPTAPRGMPGAVRAGSR